MENYDIAIIGAGPAGIMSAISASNENKRVILLEKNDIIGRKILATGNGRCNLTNKNIAVERYHGSKPEFIKNVLNVFDQDETTKFFESLGVALKQEENGRIFPRTNQASTIVESLSHVLESEENTVKASTLVKEIEKKDVFTITLENGQTIRSTKLILATGGKAAFQFGSSGDGIFWAKKLGHEIVPIFAALVPLETKEEWVKEVQGIKVQSKVTSKIGDQIVKETFGDALFTHFGLSGPAVMAHAREISPFIDNKEVTISLDLYSEISEKELDQKIENIFKNNNKKNAKNALLGLFPAGLVPIILRLAEVKPEKNAAEISKNERAKIVHNIKYLTMTVNKVRPLKEAQVSRGGVSTDEISAQTLESKLIEGLYFAGEIMDVDGDSGGFNLQWAWSSGFLAGKTK